MATRTNKSGVLELLKKDEWKKVLASVDSEMLQMTELSNIKPDELAATNLEKMENQERRIRIVKSADEGLGISVKGGKQDNLPILIARIFTGTPAADRSTDKLFVGDVILAVDGRDLSDASHKEAVDALKSVGDQVDLVVVFRKDVSHRFRQVADLGEGPVADSSSSTSSSSRPGPLLERGMSPVACVNVPLRLCFVVKESDDCLEIRYPDGTKACRLRFVTSQHREEWQEALSVNIAAQIQFVMDEINEFLCSGDKPREVRTMGWLWERLTSEDTGQHVWKPVFVALTDKEMLIFQGRAPASSRDWLKPNQNHPLICTRLVHPVLGMDQMTFVTKTGGNYGIYRHTFKAETSKELSTWIQAIVKACRGAAALIKTMDFQCTWKGQKCILNLDWESGFTLFDAGKPQKSSRGQLMLWYNGFEKLSGSGDDGNHLLWLDFGGDSGRQEIHFQKSPKYAVFILHTFLSAKTARLGLFT
ncbi:beta-1-syntrophin-like isoform X2 [Oscarella lobularis]|uniref:beta-1-syntrophin-like isoform X2 n=1 Tax=Oscarella lobularis TaxID=121494 RepID=UPI0033139C2A